MAGAPPAVSSPSAPPPASYRAAEPALYTPFGKFPGVFSSKMALPPLLGATAVLSPPSKLRMPGLT